MTLRYEVISFCKHTILELFLFSLVSSFAHATASSTLKQLLISNKSEKEREEEKIVGMKLNENFGIFEKYFETFF